MWSDTPDQTTAPPPEPRTIEEARDYLDELARDGCTAAIYLAVSHDDKPCPVHDAPQDPRTGPIGRKRPDRPDVALEQPAPLAHRRPVGGDDGGEES